MKNEMELNFDAIAENEAFARVAVSTFVANMNPTLEELADIKTAVSEAVTNAIIHGYGNVRGYEGRKIISDLKTPDNPGKVRVACSILGGVLDVVVEDKGFGIENIDKAMEPLFTTKPELDRSGMGFAFMEAFMDELEVHSVPGQGTEVHMRKKLEAGSWIDSED